MFEKFLSENAGDFRQRYEGTFGFYRNHDTKVKMLVKLVEIGNRVTFVDAAGVEYHLNIDSTSNIGFEFLPPSSAWYNTPEGALYAERIAQRQFQRGVTGKNLKIYGFTKGVLAARRVDFATLSAIYEKQLTPKEAFKTQPGQPLAISSSFCLSGGNVWLLSDVVGKFTTPDDKLFSITLDEPDLWRTEITDALKALEIPAEIR